MITSLIDVYEARRRKGDAIKNYKKVVKAIKSACDKGEDGVLVDQSLMTHQIHERLQKDNFDVTSNVHNDGKDWIYWG